MKLLVAGLYMGSVELQDRWIEEEWRSCARKEEDSCEQPGLVVVMIPHE